MKTLIILLFSLPGISAFAQNNSTVTINVTRARNSELVVDSRSFTLNTSNNTIGSNDPVVITDLPPGQHTLQMFSVSRNDDTRRKMSSGTFNTRAGFDMAINVNNDGSLQLKETSNRVRNNHKTPMSDANFSILLKDVKRQWVPGTKMTAASNAFSNPNNYFTTSQAKQLIQLISDEGNRVQLAKTAYRTIVDPANFNQLYDLFVNQISKDNLRAYVDNYNNRGNTVTYKHKAAMSEASFNELLHSAQKQWVPGEKMKAATNAFSNPNYYFTTDQARQLITLVNDENNRLQLAKLSYKTIVDPNNFSQLYDLFVKQGNRDELIAYVGSYKH